MASSVVATGRAMKGAERFTVRSAAAGYAQALLVCAVLLFAGGLVGLFGLGPAHPPDRRA